MWRLPKPFMGHFHSKFKTNDIKIFSYSKEIFFYFYFQIFYEVCVMKCEK